MTDYEIVYIFDTQLPEERIDEKLERYHALVAGENGGEITAVDNWGKRQLAYPIAKRMSGHYVVVQFRSAADALPEFERLLKLDDELLRYLIVVHAGEPTSPMSIATRQPSDDDGDDDDGDEEDD